MKSQCRTNILSQTAVNEMVFGHTTWSQLSKSAASFCCQVAAWVSVMFCNFYLVKNNKIPNNSKTAKAREK